MFWEEMTAETLFFIRNPTLSTSHNVFIVQLEEPSFLDNQNVGMILESEQWQQYCKEQLHQRFVSKLLL
jgi:hypothetical protein